MTVPNGEVEKIMEKGAYKKEEDNIGHKVGQFCIHKVLWHGKIHYVDCGMSLDQAFWFGIDKEPKK
jgi:hypothetical protein